MALRSNPVFLSAAECLLEGASALASERRNFFRQQMDGGGAVSRERIKHKHLGPCFHCKTA